ncbi:MAG: VOC family protein [Acidimicrobiales bacterium]
MSMSISAHHISFPVSDLDRSRKFYEGVLDLKEIPRADFGDVGGVWYQAGPCEVHLIAMSNDPNLGTPPPVIHPGARHVGFAVDSFDATVAHLTEHGVEVFAVADNGQIWCQDPDGHVIEFIQPGVLTV